jgi:hypothetical protein
MLMFVDGTGREQSIQDVIHLHRLVKGGVVQDSTLFGCAEELRWLPAIRLGVYRQVKEFIEHGGDKLTGVPPRAGTGTASRIASFRNTLDAHFAELQSAMKEVVQLKFHARRGWVLKWRQRIHHTT